MRSDQLEKLYARLERPLFNVVYRWVWNDEEAQEIVQDAFVRLWKMRERIDMETVEPLVYRIAINRASDKRRWRTLRRWLSLEKIFNLSDDAPLADTALAAHHERERLRRAIEELPDALRHVILLTEFSGMSYKDVAAALDIEPGTVGSRRSRAIAWLRRVLRETGDPSDDVQAKQERENEQRPVR